MSETHDETSSLQAQRRLRLEKADGLKAKGQAPFGNGTKVEHTSADVKAACGELPTAEIEALGRSFSVAGRVVSRRVMGKMAFVHLRDRAGDLQLQLKKDRLGAGWELLELLDLGDIAFARGTPIRTKTGEVTIVADELKILTKALRPMPEKFHGLTDVESRYRQRYLDLATDPAVRAVFQKRSQLVSYIRRFLDERGFLEVETPMMHPLVTGAAARPFVTHHNTLDMKLYLRIAPELYLKRLVVGGFERVYEINRNFRNEGISTRHNPEFTMLEFYMAHATYEDLMDLTEAMVSGAAQALTGASAVSYQGRTIEFAAPWARRPMEALVIEAVTAAGLSLAPTETRDPAKLRTLALHDFTGSPKERAAIEAEEDWGRLLALLFEQHVEKNLVNPTFVTGFPTSISPLARCNDADPGITDRFELFCAGREIANAFSELNDPIDQKERFVAQVAAKAKGDAEAMDHDEDYIVALEHGMPPTAGEGIGIDRLAMLLTDAASIRDVILFPLLKSRD